MLRKVAAPVFLAFLIILSTGVSPSGENGRILCFNAGAHPILAVFHASLNGQRYLEPSDFLQYTDRYAEETGKTLPLKKRLGKLAGQTTDMARANSFQRPTPRTAHVVLPAGMPDLNIPKNPTAPAAINATPQSLAVVMPIPRSPPGLFSPLAS